MMETDTAERKKTGQQLSHADQEQYQKDGYFFPLRIFSTKKAAYHREQLENLEVLHGSMHYKVKPYLLMKSAAEIANNSVLLDAVECILGPDIMLWDSAYVIKEPNNTKYVSWHQDLTYWGLDSDELVTAWVALSTVKTQNGCMKMLPGSHHKGKKHHRSTYNKDNILHRGQELSAEIDDEQTVSLELEAGEASLHHGWVAHGSHPNFSEERRIGLTLQYLAPSVRQKHTDRESATLVRGEGRYGNFRPEPICTEDFAPEMQIFQAEVERLKHEVYDTN